MIDTLHNKSRILFLSVIIATLDFHPIYVDYSQSAYSMDATNITSILIHNASYPSLTTVSSTEEDPRILAASHLMYKIGKSNISGTTSLMWSGIHTWLPSCLHGSTTVSGKYGRNYCYIAFSP